MLNLLDIGQQTWEAIKHTQPADTSIEDYYKFLWGERKNVRAGYDDLWKLSWLIVAERTDDALAVKLLVILGHKTLKDIIEGGQHLFGPFNTVKYKRRFSSRQLDYTKLWKASKVCNHRAQ